MLIHLCGKITTAYECQLSGPTEFYHSWNRNIVPNSPESWEALTR